MPNSLLKTLTARISPRDPRPFSPVPALPCLALVCLFGLLALPSAAGAARHKVWAGPQERYARAEPAGAVPDDETFTVGIGLPWRDEDAVQALIADLYDRHSPSYRHFLDPQSFIAQFSPTTQDYQKLLDYAAANGLSVRGIQANRLLITVSGTAGAFGRAFGVGFARRRRADGSAFRVPVGEPSIDLDLPVTQVTGLDDYERLRPSGMRPTPRLRRQTADGSGTGGAYQGGDFRAAYCANVPSGLNGAGQAIGLFEADAFFQSDISAYEQGANLPANVPAVVLVDGATGKPSDPGGVGEVSLDIEMLVSMAPNASIVCVEGPNDAAMADDVLSAIATHQPVLQQISCSWFGFGDTITAAVLEQYAVQGQAFFLASGDAGAFGPGDAAGTVTSPEAISPMLTSVGGTNLSTESQGGPWSGETTWNEMGGASGGGICTGVLAIPDYQSPVPMGANGGSKVWRNVPDVAMCAENIWVDYMNGLSGAFGGTSAAAPLWAGFTALVNQQAAAQGVAPLGFANPALYDLGRSSGYGASFHDINDNSTNNFNGGDGVFYTAVTGYDLCTGWGSPNGMALISGLVGLIPIIGTSGLQSTPQTHFVTFPNPFNPWGPGTLSMRFAPSSGGARLKVYDESYRMVYNAVLDSTAATQGVAHFCACDSQGRTLEPGSYYAVLVSSGSQQRCKFTVRR